MCALDIGRVAKALSGVRGIKAVVLGGSRSRGESTDLSDYDIGVYYGEGELDTERLDQALQSLDDGGRQDLLNPPGQWGPWINGGAWIAVNGAPVDILLRDTGRVRQVLGDCLSGRITIDYQCGHPFGFVNAIYAAEIHYCRILWQDREEAVDILKAMIHSDGDYPPRMRRAIIDKLLWEANFSLACGRKPALAGELNYAMGSVFRSVCCWIWVLYTLNNKFLMNEKGALGHIKALVIRPDGMESRVREAYGLLAAGKLETAYSLLDALHDEIMKLACGHP